jgi:hypothetical protein
MKKIETFIYGQLLKESMEDDQDTRLVKYATKAYLRASEKELDHHYAKMYKNDPTMVINIAQKLELIAQTVSKLQLDEMVLFADFAEKFYENREQIKTDAETFFNEILL